MTDQDKRLKELATIPVGDLITLCEQEIAEAADVVDTGELSLNLFGEPRKDRQTIKKRRHYKVRWKFTEIFFHAEKCLELCRRLDAAERRVKELEAQTELHKRWHKKPAHGSCCTCQRCGLDYDTCRCVLDECADELELLKVRCQELEKDRERLDWLLENGASVGSFTGGRDWVVFNEDGDIMHCNWQPTPRAAIDDTREREGGDRNGDR